jgi:hypothetical protein
MKKQPRQFYVWNPQSGPPAHMHGTEESARTEAARLARNWPGQEFFVLATVCMITKNDICVVEFDEDDLPF